MRDADRLVSFASVHQAIKAETVLLQIGVRTTALPTPREISISCGQCLLFAKQDEAKVMEAFAANGVMWSKVYSRDAERRVYELLAEYGRDT